MADLLYEIGTEDLPAGYLEPALDELQKEIRRRLYECRLGGRTQGRTAGTPRRLAVAFTGIAAEQPTEETTVVGPPASVAFDSDGNPTAVAEGFARSRGVSVEALHELVEETPKGRYVVLRSYERGKLAGAILPDLLRQATADVPFPKSMRWEASGFPFARPIRWLVALLDDEVLDLSIAGVRAGRATRGHPFLAPGEIALKDASFEAYLAALRKRCVVADVEERREALRAEIGAVLARHGSEMGDEELLGEVTNMVEFPHALEGAFDEHFLTIPAAVLSAAMKEHQRYFPVSDTRGKLVPRFVTVSDRTAEQDEQVRAGHERVLRARLEDAKFYWDQDSRRPLEELVPLLEEVVFLGGLGNNLQRSERLAELGARIAGEIGLDASQEHVRRAGRLCKADLLTGLVGEFPSLQGVVGRELALAGGEPKAVADAIAEHYLPAGADDALPATPEGAALALADKLDVIVGCFSLGLLPSGSQDPYALRRNARAVLLIAEDRGVRLKVNELLSLAVELAREDGIECKRVDEIMLFLWNRVVFEATGRGYRHDFVDAVLETGWEDIPDFWRRLEAIQECAGRDWWPALVELVDRTYRIQRDAERILPVDEGLLQEPLEKELHAALRENRDEVAELLERRLYVEAAERYCSAFARLVHDFFEEVFVNVEDEALRLNRKALCAEVYHLFADRFADLYLIETAEGEG
ncbi:MAG: glycine--tRNA ligase subunit beta [Planctomycetota bacterium]|jgi:glycyl-tRNA synthetase beta chain